MEMDSYVAWVMVNILPPPYYGRPTNTVLGTVIPIPLLEGKLEHFNKTQKIDNMVR